jgi:hypothetical protein
MKKSVIKIRLKVGLFLLNFDEIIYIFFKKALLDVKKAKDLSGFYDTLLKMKTGEIKIEEEGEKDKRIERERKEKYVFFNFFIL